MMYDPGGRYRRRAEEGRRRAFMLVAVLGILGFISYWWGAESVRSRETAFKQEAVKLREERVQLEKTVTSLRSEVQSTQVRYQQMEARCDQDIPKGDFKKLTDILKKRLDSGIKADRLAAALDATRPPKNCGEPVTKRFIIKTPVYSGPHGSVTFANGAITVSGQGESAVGPAKKAEAWYDSGKPVSITFTTAGGKETVRSGLLPIQHSVVLANKEYRFTVAAGQRSFISVTSDVCDYYP